MSNDQINTALSIVDKVTSLGIMAIMLKFWITQYVGIRTDYIQHLEDEVKSLRGKPIGQESQNDA